MKISIIIPTYKRSEYLTRAIDSILKQKGNYEIIVVDDNDENSEYRKENEKRLKKYIDENEIIYLKHTKNLNGAAARNTGISAATGEYITFLDDDDIFCANRIEEIENVIKKENEPEFICTGIQFKRNGSILKETIPNLNKSNEELIKDLLKQKSFVGTGSNIVCKKEIVDKINGFDEKFLRHQDLEFLIRFLECSKTNYCIEKILVIKNNDDTINVPNFEKFYNTKKMFLDKFSYIIDKYDKKTKKDIYTKNYYELLDTAYFLSNKDYIIQAKKLLKDNNIYSFFKETKIIAKNKLKRMKIISFVREKIAKFKRGKRK